MKVRNILGISGGKDSNGINLYDGINIQTCRLENTETKNPVLVYRISISDSGNVYAATNTGLFVLMKAPVPRPTLQLVDKVSRSCGHTPGKVAGQRATVKAEPQRQLQGCNSHTR